MTIGQLWVKVDHGIQRGCNGFHCAMIILRSQCFQYMYDNFDGRIDLLAGPASTDTSGR